MSKEHLQWSEDNLTIWRTSWFHGERSIHWGFRTWGSQKKEVPSLINSIRHGLLRVRAPILCYAFWRTLSMGAHPLRWPGVRHRVWVLEVRTHSVQDLLWRRVPFVPLRPLKIPSRMWTQSRANQASIIRFMDASLHPTRVRILCRGDAHPGYRIAARKIPLLSMLKLSFSFSLLVLLDLFLFILLERQRRRRWRDLSHILKLLERRGGKRSDNGDDNDEVRSFK